MGDNVFGGSGNSQADLDKHNAMMQDRRSREILSPEQRERIEAQKIEGKARLEEENAIKAMALETARNHASAKIVQLPSSKTLEKAPDAPVIIPANVKVTKIASKGEGKRKGGGKTGPREKKAWIAGLKGELQPGDYRLIIKGVDTPVTLDDGTTLTKKGSIFLADLLPSEVAAKEALRVSRAHIPAVAPMRYDFDRVQNPMRYGDSLNYHNRACEVKSKDSGAHGGKIVGTVGQKSSVQSGPKGIAVLETMKWKINIRPDDKRDCPPSESFKLFYFWEDPKDNSKDDNLLIPDLPKDFENIDKQQE